MLTESCGCDLRVERGPDWLIVKIDGIDESADNPSLAEHIWTLMQQHLTHRLVLEMDKVPALTGFMLNELDKLYELISRRDGVMRLCGLSARNIRLLKSRRMEDRFLPYQNRKEAVMGCTHPAQPR
jgi:hypothetical protein